MIKTNDNVSEKLTRFTLQETRLLELAKMKGLALPERLTNWRFWIGDSAIYLNELRDLVDRAYFP